MARSRSLREPGASSVSKGIAAAALALSGGAALALYTGFPKRVGLTKAQALVSMPGDLVYPLARKQADRAVQLLGTQEEIWPLVEDLMIAYQDLWDVPLVKVYRQEPDLLVLRTSAPIAGGGPDKAQLEASVAAQLIPGVDGTTTVQLRERYATGLREGKVAAAVLTASSAVLVPRWGRGARRLLKRSGAPLFNPHNQGVVQEGLAEQGLTEGE